MSKAILHIKKDCFVPLNDESFKWSIAQIGFMIYEKIRFFNKTMNSLQEFADRYKKLSNSELLDILQHPGNYQPLAVEAAKNEMASRQLSEEDIYEARQTLLARQFKKDQLNEKNELLKSKLIEAGNVLYDTINPIQTSPASAIKLVRLISIVFTGLILYQLVNDFQLITFILRGKETGFGFTLYLFPLLIEISGTILFWLKNQVGWILLSLFCSLSLVETCWSAYMYIKWQLEKKEFFFSIGFPSPVVMIVSMLLFVATIYVLCRKDIREIYRIDNPIMKLFLIAGTVLGILFIFIMNSN